MSDQNLAGEQKHEAWRDEMLRRSGIDSKAVAAFTALHRSVVDFALSAVRGGIFLNGGGAVAVLSFMAASKDLRTLGLLDGLCLFVAGATFSAVTAGISYIAQSYFTSELDHRWGYEIFKNPDEEKKAKQVRSLGDFYKYIGCITMGAAYFLFILGCISTYYALKSITTNVGG